MESKIQCRTQQFAQLRSLFGQKHQYPPAALFLYGHTSTGKSLVTSSLMTSMKLPYVLVNCVECYNARFLYEHILNSLTGELDTTTEKSEVIKCDNMNDFVRLLQGLITDQQLESETLYIDRNKQKMTYVDSIKLDQWVLDKAERLRDMDANILPAFLRLQELTHRNVCVVLMSEIVWEKYRYGTGFCEPFVIHFPDYTKDEMIRIMVQDCPEGYSEGFYTMYVNLVLSIFHYACRDLKELRHLVTLNFTKYVQPIKAGEATVNDTKKLWKNIEPHLKRALQTLYLREVSSSQWEKYQAQLEQTDNMALEGLSHRSHVELPFYSKYLLIAAYLASYNPAKSDKKFFSKHSGRGNKKKQLVKKKERASNHMLGPKPFPLDRLMAIFYSIVEGRVAPSANIFMQITSLVSLHLLGQVSGEDQIEQPKYKCLISLDFIKSVSRTVNFEVTRYLYDFV